MLNFSFTLCYGACPVVTILVGGVWAGFCYFSHHVSRASTALSKHGDPSDRHVPDFQHACAGGGGGVTFWMNKETFPSPAIKLRL